MKYFARHIKVYLVIIFVYFAYLVCNVLTPMVIDDCSYASTGRSLSEIWTRESHDYFTWSGRLVAHSVAQFWSGIVGKGVFDFVNPIMMCAIVVLVCLFSSSKKVHPINLIVCFTLLWFLIPDQYVTQFMVAGSMNYIWATVIVLSWLYCLTKDGGRRWHSLVLLAIFSIIAGAWSEMYAISIIPAIVLCLYCYRRKYKWSVRLAIMLLCFSVGAAFVVLAPGNFSRMNGLSQSTPFGTRLVNTLVYVFKSPLPFLWLATVVLWFLQKKRCPDFWRSNIFWFAAMFCSIAFCVVSGASWPRTHFPVYIFSIILLMKQLALLSLKRWMQIVFVLLALALVSVDLYNENHILYKQTSAVNFVRDNASKEVVLTWSGIKRSRKSISENVFSCYNTNWRNVAFAKYHGLPSFVVVPQQVMDAVCSMEADSVYTCHNYTVRRLPHGYTRVDGIRITYTEDTVFRYPAKMARLVSLFGVPLNDRCYAKRQDAPFLSGLLRMQNGLYAEYGATSDDESVDAYGIVSVPDGTWIYYPKSYETMCGYSALRFDVIGE